MPRLPLLFLCLTFWFCSLSAQSYPWWQRTYFGVEGGTLPIPDQWGGTIQANVGYQHTDYLGVGLSFGHYSRVDLYPAFIRGPALQYRLATRRIRVQAELGWVRCWRKTTSSSFDYRYAGKNDPFFRLTTAWQPIPLVVFGAMAVLTPPLRTEYYRMDTGVVHNAGQSIFFTFQPFIGIQIPGRWRKSRK